MSRSLLSYVPTVRYYVRYEVHKTARLDVWLHELIEDRETPPEKQEKPGREVIVRVIRGGGTYQLEMVRCGKSRCRSCPHGPYWYQYWKEGGRTKSKYIGKASREEKFRFASEIAKSKMGNCSPVISAGASKV